MKKIYGLFLLTGMLIMNINAYSQCTPDPSCMEIDNPGEICPATLPDGQVGVPYSEVVTIIPPATAVIGGQTINIIKIKLKSVGNMPPGLSYQCSPANCEFPVTDPYTRYCALISGTPTQAGVYDLAITVTPYISVFGQPTPVTDQVDDTSLTIIIHPAVFSATNNLSKFTVLDSKPNPFSLSTRIGFLSPNSSLTSLSVFDIVGNLVCTENITSSKGENYFDFNGSELGKGVYFYTIDNGKEKFTKQLIKN